MPAPNSSSHSSDPVPAALVRTADRRSGLCGRFRHLPAALLMAAAMLGFAAVTDLRAADDTRPNAVAFRNMKHGIFVTQTYGLTPAPAGVPATTLDEFANAFDVPVFADQVAGMGMEYVIFTAWHKSIYCLGPNTALENWLPGHTARRDLIGEIADALHARNIKLIIYPHPNDGHDLTAAEQARVGFWDATGNYKVYNDFVNEVNNEVCDRYAGKPNVIGFWWDSWWHNNGRLDMPRLRANTLQRAPEAVILSNNRNPDYIDFLSIEGASMGSLNTVTAEKDNLTWYVAGDWWSVGAGASISISPEDMYRFTLLTAGCGAPGGMAWALSPMADGKTWGASNQPLAVMRTLANHIAPVRRTVCGVSPSHNWVLPGGITWAQAPAFVAARNPVTRNEYVHVVKPPATRFIDLPLPTESFAAARMYLSQSPVAMDSSSGSLRLTLPPGENWSSLDTVIELTSDPGGFAPSVTVTFQSNGGSAVGSQTLMSGDVAIRPANPGMTGFSFVRWCSDAALATAFDFGTPVTGDMTLYAKWAIASCTVGFNSNGGSSVASQTVTYNGMATRPTPDPTRAGHRFAGWYADAGLTAEFDFGTPVTGDISLHAKWVLLLQSTTNTSGSNHVVTFTSGSGEWEVPAGVTELDVLVVGGGGGGQGYGGGGGGGGFCGVSNHIVTPGDNISVVVGDGGAGSLRGAGTGPYPQSSKAGDGQNSVFGTIIAYGGSGGNWVWTSSGAGYGRGGTSGGNNVNSIGGLVAALPSNNYGSGSGVGTAGLVGTSAQGGAGLSNSITGTTTWYGGGGGALVNGLGGIGGGGAGHSGGDNNGYPGQTNTGGGGGAGHTGVGGKGGSGVVIVAYTAGIPPAPGALMATVSDQRLDLSWNAADGATSYNVKRSLVDGGPYTVIAADVTGTSYADTGLTNGVTYYYVVSASNGAGESADSASVGATPALVVPAAPTGLQAIPSSSQVSLTWNAPVGANGYSVKRSPNSNGPYTRIANNLAATSFLDTGLANGTTYYYVVSASNDAGEGADSSVINATPEAPAPLRIMCVGDSITAGYTDNPSWSVPFQFGYRSGLYQRLTSAGFVFQFVGGSAEPWNGVFGTPANTPVPDLRSVNQDRHRGYGGQGTGHVMNNIAAWLSADNPDIVLLMIGINDLGLHQLTVAKNNLNNIVGTIVSQKPAANVVVAQITPGANNGYVLQEFIDYNTYIREDLVPSFQQQGKRVTTVDQYANFPLKNGQVDPSLFANAINHPTAAAYDRMAQTWLAGIQAADYADWARGYPGFALSNPAADADGDGFSNKSEYAFGLDPTRGSSASPVTVDGMLRGAGRFSYTRRANSALSYSVWTSTDLRTWTRDPDAIQTPAGQTGDNLTVEVTLGSSRPDGKLFVRVRAE